ncbi:hypothetical protein TSUD_309720 [Trifolium subterraneum]|uniref:Uncharacterized protein n=1 Tax=Trifolium subterraneum TaxID=3900 RepID=A0A2Z6LVM0_TRISU|nr:hypothetical protein TSUD_309720 [Trifolium subterraneum]
MKLFSLLGKFQTSTAFENKRIREVIRCGYMVVVVWLEHEEEERKCLKMMGGIGTMRISTNDGVVIVRVERWVCVEKKTSVVEVTGG